MLFQTDANVLLGPDVCDTRMTFQSQLTFIAVDLNWNEQNINYNNELQI
jgi:hypothetical protein